MRRAALLAVVVMLSACSRGAVPTVNNGPMSRTISSVSSTGSQKIKHVIIVVQENRTFDNLFHGFPGADTVSTGMTHDGKVVKLTAGPLEEYYDLGHTHKNFETEYDHGANNGFDLVPTSPQSYPTAPYQYVIRSQVQPYFDIASEFTIADHNFPSQNGPSFPGHEYLIAGQAAGADDDPTDEEPWGCDAPSGTTVPVYLDYKKVENVFPCFDYETLGDELDNANLSWRYYTTVGTQEGFELLPDPYDAVKHIRDGADWQKDTVTPPTQIISDIKNGNLPAVAWLNSPALASDHPQFNDGHGPSWVASVVNAVGESSYYDNTVVLVTWDDWGGWYEHVTPQEYGVWGRGFRVPLLVVSAWSKHGYVSHPVHEFGSMLRFTEEVFGLPSLGQRDAVSDDLADCFDFTQNPPPFKPIHLNMPINLQQLARDTRPNDNY